MDLTAAATIAVNAAAGGGPVDWQSRLPEGTEQFLAATRIGSTEAGLAVEFREAMANWDMSWLQAAMGEQSGNAFSQAAAGSYLFARRHGAGAGGGLAAALIGGSYWAGDVATDLTTFVAGEDLFTGEQVSGAQRLLSGGTALLELFPSGAGRVADGLLAGVGKGIRGTVRVGGKAIRATGHAVESAGRVANRFVQGFGPAYRQVRGNQLIYAMSDPTLGIASALGNIAEGVVGGVRNVVRSDIAESAGGIRLKLQFEAGVGLRSFAPENAARQLALPAPRSAKTWRNTPGVAFGSGHKIGDQWIHQGRVGFVPEEVAAGLRGRQFEKFDDFQEAFWKQVGEHPRLMAEFSPSNQGLIRRGQAPFAIPSQQTGGGAANMRFNLHHLKKIESGGSVYDIDNIVIASPYHHLNAFHR